ncbi:ROK family protein [Candidatus Saccharibacteria bacterium]|nr:ROK family protein [Candidatus Saccharibacteria bacterium]
MAKNYGAVDIGGTKTLVAIFDSSGEIKEQNKFPTPQNYEDFVKELAKNVDNLSTKEIQAFCVAAPGRVDRHRGIGIRFGNLGWENVTLIEDLEQIFKAPGMLENDAKSAAYSEAKELQKKYKKVLYITVSTGIGCGYIINGIIDPKFADMEVGHMLLEHNGEFERWEDFASGKAIVNKFGKKASDITDKKDWYIISRNIAVGLINVIATLTPDIIIVGGGVGSHLDKFKDQLDERLITYENPMLTIPPIVKAKRPEEAVIYGCYELAKEKYGHSGKKT